MVAKRPRTGGKDKVRKKNERCDREMVSQSFVEEITIIQNDSLNGAVELTKRTLEAIKKEITRTTNLKEELPELIQMLSLVHPEMASIAMIVKQLKQYENSEPEQDEEELKKRLQKELEQLGQEITRREQQTVEMLCTELKKYKTIMTISSSTTIRTALAMIPQKEREKEIYILESRPLLEGQTLATQLAKMGYKVKLFVDAAAGHYMREVEAVVVGADTIFRDGSILNKIGSLALALLARKYGIPFIVAASKNKLSTEAAENYGFYLQEKPPEEVYPEEIPNLTVLNIYFDFVPKELITTLISK